jgi:hypothetical protein
VLRGHSCRALKREVGEAIEISATQIFSHSDADPAAVSLTISSHATAVDFLLLRKITAGRYDECG